MIFLLLHIICNSSLQYEQWSQSLCWDSLTFAAVHWLCFVSTNNLRLKEHLGIFFIRRELSLNFFLFYNYKKVWAMSYQNYSVILQIHFRNLCEKGQTERFIWFKAAVFLYHVQKLKSTVEIAFLFLRSKWAVCGLLYKMTRQPWVRQSAFSKMSYEFVCSVQRMDIVRTWCLVFLVFLFVFLIVVSL